MAPDARRSGLGWVILAAALAVPGFLFYNWWSHLKAEHDKGVAAKARTRAAEGSVFQTPPARPLGAVAVSTAASAPMAGAQAAPTANAASNAMPNTMPNRAAAPLGNAPLNPTPNPIGGTPRPAAPAAGLNTMAAPSPSAFANAVSSGTAEGGVALSSATVLTLSRDPMMSPMDAVRLREAEAEAERNRQAIIDARMNANRPRKSKIKKEPPIESRIELQGIIARPDGDNMAIVNGATINPGELFSVDGFASKVKVLKITSSEVTFEYKNKHFKKNVNAE